MPDVLDVDARRLQVVERIESRDATMAFDSKIVNGLVEQGQDRMRAIKRAGLTVSFTGFAGKGQGLDDYNGTLFGISGDVLNQFGASTGLVLNKVTPNGGFGVRDGAAAAGFLGALYIIGGVNNGVLSGDAWKSVTGTSWGQVTTVPAALVNRAFAKAVVLNNMLYVMGGQDATGTTYFNDVWSTSDGATWTQILANAPWTPRADFEVLVYGGQIYLAGGQGMSSPNGTPDTGLAHDVWATNNGTTWTLKNAAAPWLGRRRFGFFMSNATMNVLGGVLFNGSNTTFANATADQWQSTDFGVTWTRSSTNAFAVGGSPMLSVAVVTSIGQDIAYGRALTVVNGAGGSGATAYGFAYGDEELYDDEWVQDHDINTVTFTNVGSGYTTACTFSDPTNDGSIAVAGYGLLDGTTVSGGRAGEVVFSNGQYYYFTTYINGALSNEIWTSTDGATWKLQTSTPGYATRSMEVFVFGNIWIIGGANGTTYFNDVWTINSASGQFALNPTVANEFYYFNQTSTSLVTPLLVFASPHQGYTFNSALGVLTRITNANYPTVIVPGLVYLDTTFYVMDPEGRIWGSALNDPSTWTALNEIAIQNEPNGGVGIAKLGQYLVGFGQWTVQFFYDAANAPPGSPLSENQTLQYQVGCVNGRTIVEAQSTIVWVGQTVKEGTKVYQFQGYAPQIISTPFIDRVLANDTMQNVTAYITQMFGHPCYILTLYQSGVTLVYDMSTQFWSVWTSLSLNNQPTNLASVTITGVSNNNFALLTVSTAPNQHGLQDGDPAQITGLPSSVYNGIFNVTVISPTSFSYVVSKPDGNPVGSGQVARYVSSVFLPVTAHELPNNIYYLQDPSNGNVYSVNYTTGGDFGNPIDFSIVTGRWDGGTMYVKTVIRVSLIGDMTSSLAYIRNTKTDYQTWSAYRPVNMQAQWAFISSLGQCSRLAYQIRHTAFTPQRFEALEHDIEIGV